MTNKYSLTQRKVYEMMKENTGTHFLDSGGAYGRHWQRNQLIPLHAFARTPRVYMSARWGVEVTVSLFHFLSSVLEYNVGMNRSLRAFDRTYKGGKEEWSDVLEAWVKSKGWYDSTRHLPNGCTYNEKNKLSQDFVYVLFEANDDVYAVIRTHNGCDARGGFSTPLVFEVKGYEPTVIYNHDKVDVGCSKCDARWDTYYDGHSLSYVGDGDYPGGRLEDYKTVHVDDYRESDEYKELQRQLDNVKVIPVGQYRIDGTMVEKEEYINLPDPKQFIPDNVILYDDENVYCPFCGEPLWADAWWDC